MVIVSSTDDRAVAPGGDGLAVRLAHLRSVSVAHLLSFEVRGHLAQVRDYLHDEVLRRAHTEELVLFPELDRRGGVLRRALVAEHDTVREATAALDDLADRPITRPHVHRLEGLLEGIALLLDGHLHHEADAALEYLQQLAADERERLLAAGAWRRALLDHSRYRLQLPYAEECMHLAGMWPWHT